MNARQGVMPVYGLDVLDKMGNRLRCVAPGGSGQVVQGVCLFCILLSAPKQIIMFIVLFFRILNINKNSTEIRPYL